MSFSTKICCFPILFVILVGSDCKLLSAKGKLNEKKSDFFQHPAIEVDDVLRGRGYLAKNYKFITDDGYILTLTRARNPLINNGETGLPDRDPILLVHGLLTNANAFIVNSFQAEPKDFTDTNLNELSREEAIELFGDEPSADNLATFALNHGYEVWFLHRRGTTYSRKRLSDDEIERRTRKLLTPHQKLVRTKAYARRFFAEQAEQLQFEEERRRERKKQISSNKRRNRPVRIRNQLTELIRIELDKITPTKDRRGKKHNKLLPVLKSAPEAFFNISRKIEEIKVSLDFKYWNFSLDEQAAYDLPNAIDFVRLETGSDKVAMVGQSCGGALVVMTHTMNPELTEKVSRAIAWGPSLVLGYDDGAKGIVPMEPLLNFIGPYMLPVLSAPTQAIAMFFCSLEIMQKTLCEWVTDRSLGPTKGQAPYRPEYMTTHYISASNKETAQHLQFARHGKPRMYDHGTAESNLVAYGQVSPPDYDLGSIVFDKISIWSSMNDKMITFNDSEVLTSKLRVPHRLFLIDQKGVSFNHDSYIYHRDVAKIVIIPALMDIASSRKEEEEEE